MSEIDEADRDFPVHLVLLAARPPMVMVVSVSTRGLLFGVVKEWPITVFSPSDCSARPMSVLVRIVLVIRIGGTGTRPWLLLVFFMAVES
jgi:hypothetical protein